MRGLFSDVIADQVMGYVICFARNLHLYVRNQESATWAPVGGEAARVDFAAGPGVVNPIDLPTGIYPIRRSASSASARSGRRSLVGRRRSACGSWPSTRCGRSRPGGGLGLAARPAAGIAWGERLRGHRGPAHAGDGEALPPATQFRQMKPTAYLINIGRGAIVDLADLTEALRANEIAGAALDVFEIEPLPADHPLWSCPNVILTPHVAGYSPRIAERHLGVLLENIRRFVRDEPLLNVVDKAAWF